MSTENEKQEHIPNEVALTETELAETETEAELAETEIEAELAETETEAEITETVRKEAGPTEGPFAEQTEAIANEMAWSKFQRLVKSQKDRQEDPVKYAGLGVGTKVFFCCLIALLSLGVVFTIVMHFISKNNDELPVANGAETVVSQDADTQKPGSENTAETEEEVFVGGFAVHFDGFCRVCELVEFAEVVEGVGMVFFGRFVIAGDGLCHIGCHTNAVAIAVTHGALSLCVVLFGSFPVPVEGFGRISVGTDTVFTAVPQVILGFGVTLFG